MRKSVAVAMLAMLLVSTLSFVIFKVQADPLTIFSDGFESGVYVPPWTSTSVGNGDTLAIDNSVSHHGTCSSKLITGTKRVTSYSRKTFAPQSPLYARLYWKISDVSNTPFSKDGRYVNALKFEALSGTSMGFGLKKVAGSVKWELQYRSSGAWAYAQSNTPTPTANTWYSIEVQMTTGATGSYTVWIDGNQIISVTNVDNDDRGLPNEIWTPSHHYVSSSVAIWVDCVVVSDMQIGLENMPPVTTLNIDSPHYVSADGTTYLTSYTSLNLVAYSPQGSPITATAYRIHNEDYYSEWTTYTDPFNLVGLAEGTYHVDYNSTDNLGNVESTKTKMVIQDNTPPSPIAETPSDGDALQDGVTLKALVQDVSGVESVAFSIREADGDIISPEFESIPATLSDGKWQAPFDTTELPDGYYRFVIEAADVLGNMGTITVPFSIRNWAMVEMLPASERNKAGRTMPVKFSIRIKESVDPAQPFVQNEELTIKIYRKGYPQRILQTSTYGPKSTDYRIAPYREHYITNFRTLKTPATYVVEVHRNGMLLGSFEFETVE